MQQLNYKNYTTGITLTLITSFILFVFNFLLGKNELFLALNTDLGNIADYFFVIMTALGNGWCWLIWLIIFIIYRRKLLPLLIASFALSTLFTQGIKNLIFTAEPRPTKAIADINLIHTVKGVELHTVGSFPSGHTATAFTFFLLLCLVVNKKWIVPIGFLYAILTAYSRVYLAQHFPRDLAAGMLVAVVSVWLSLLIQKRFFNIQ
jgi:membrane-associated phospholipid phosphatase